MHILLLILKIIGIILLVLLGLILLLICALLFSPVRYQADGTLLEEKSIRIRAGWLGFVARVACAVDIESQSVSAKVRVFGIPVFSYPKPEAAAKKKRKRRKKKRKRTGQAGADPGREKADDVRRSRVQADTAQAAQAAPENAQTAEAEIEEELRHMEAPKSDAKAAEERENTEAPENGEKKRRSPKEILLKIKEWISGIPQKLKQIRKKLAHIRDMLYDGDNKAALAHLYREVRYLLKHYGPRKMKADLRFSAGDPALTGQLLGIICIFPIVYRDEMHLVPDFEADRFYVEGTFRIKGHIRLIHVLRAGIRIWKDKNIRKFIRK